MTPRLVDEALAAELLLLGEVVAAATESSFGLLADASSAAAVTRLLASKPRAQAGIGLILPDAAALPRWATEIPAAARALMERWPGALTLVLPARAEVDPRLTRGGTLGVRVAGPSAAARLAQRTGLALTATSANPTGRPPALSAAAVARELPQVWAVYGRAPGGLPSTYVGFQGGAPVLLRAGRVPVTAPNAALR
ncbi:MAG: Sua5/YciO/YrdC/YwlC family protein [Polyangiaceae bacterium]|nr:Sua5/YciO/YrdC/YwlC family protein [Polyangiaceae bacterium]MCW5791608.1 Sua5/YciO/YrdC/YwlC family protein [Polyangiaceae bacterium]